ncbi:MAG: response regulator, partial [Pseudomonadota bacterium]
MARTKVLVVEDEESIVTLLEYNFRRENFQVIVANDGEDALLKVEETQPDIVILDWMLPKMSGVEVCRQLRSNVATGNIPVILLTARSEENDRIRGLDIGADDYLTKPFSPAELIARMRAVLRRIRPALVDREVHHGDIRVDRA